MRGLRLGRVFQPHLAQHVAAIAAHVDILSAVAKGRRLFDNGHLEAIFGQPPGGGGASDAGSGDQDAAGHEQSPCVLP
jgi:hypothetical protein